MPQHHLTSLNPPQREAVLHTEGPLLIVAGAGAGKTKTLTTRILHLIESGVEPHRILAITFTNKAAREMDVRVRELLTHAESGTATSWGTQEFPFLGTFHGLGSKIIRDHGRELGVTRHFTIFDRDNSLRAVKEAMEKAGISTKQFEPRKALGGISRAKGANTTLEEYRDGSSNEYFTNIIARIWEEYAKILTRAGALDFDDLLLKPMRLLKERTDIREQYHDKWHYIHVDEYQDTNTVQYELARLLVGPQQNICVVGDADQTIYTWRGANINNILRFEKDYVGAKTILLEQNYRSTKTILTASNQIISKNKLRAEKNLFTKNTDGEQISLYAGYDEADEASHIMTEIRSLIQSGEEPKEIAVLYRANFQSRVLEESALEHGVPYQVLGTRFFERKEVKDALSYIRSALNRNSLVDIRRSINTPARGIGAVTLAKFATGGIDALTGGAHKKVSAYLHILDNIQKQCETMLPSEVIKYTIEVSGISKSLKGETDSAERIENLKELVSLALRYDLKEKGEGIVSLLEDASLTSDQDSLTDKTNAVRLMTVHASKGLEFDFVFVSGLEEGLFPLEARGENPQESAEEERRLCYVAFTRARKKLFLSFASVRTIYGQKQGTIPSQFILDIDETLLDTPHEEESRGKIVYLD